MFILPHTVASEPYIKAFQFKILNCILFIIRNYLRLDTANMIDALFAIKNQKRYIIFFTTAFALTCSGKNLKNIT